MLFHFENLQSTNWNSMRFKPPPQHDSKIGWRVEFRTMDIQLTDFENACLIIILGLVVNVINHFNVDFIIPISKADDNMKRAHFRNALLSEKFWFNKNCVQSERYWESNLHKSDFTSSKNDYSDFVKPEYEEMYIYEILKGKEGSSFKGIFPLIKKFMEVKKYSEKNIENIEFMMHFICSRARGSVPTGAAFIREIINQTPTYKHDSKLSHCTMTILVSQLMRL